MPILYRIHFGVKSSEGEERFSPRGSSSGLLEESGLPVSILTTFMLQLLFFMEKRPSHFAMVADSRGKTWRHDYYPEYKANRPPQPPEIAVALDFIQEVADALQIKVVRAPGVEADDTLATLCRRAEAQGMQVDIITPDKDLFQVLSPRVHLYRKRGEDGTLESYDVHRFRSEFGVEPSQFCELQGLMGDASDNYKGVKGIGIKIATQLIQTYGSLENLFEKLDEVKPGHVQKKLREGKEEAFRCRRLATLAQDLQDHVLYGAETMDELRMQMPKDGGIEVFRLLECLDSPKIRHRLRDLYRAMQGEAKPPSAAVQRINERLRNYG
eukprot:jgi/Mesvir1/19595/Mv09895-RA.1